MVVRNDRHHHPRKVATAPARGAGGSRSDPPQPDGHPVPTSCLRANERRDPLSERPTAVTPYAYEW